MNFPQTSALDVVGPREVFSYRGQHLAKVLVSPQRTLAEDRLWVDAPQQVAAIVDGVSTELGAQASDLAIDTLKSTLADAQTATPTHDLMALMNHSLWQENCRLLAKHPSINDRRQTKLLLASALVMRIVGDGLYFSHIGDTRLMVWREGVLHSLTEDHSLLQEAIANGRLAPDERLMIESPLRHVLTRCLGEWQEDIPTGTWRLESEDIIIAASDGLTHTLLLAEIEGLIRTFRPFGLPAMMEALFAQTQKAGLSDDVSVIVFNHQH